MNENERKLLVELFLHRRLTWKVAEAGDDLPYPYTGQFFVGDYSLEPSVQVGWDEWLATTPRRLGLEQSRQLAMAIEELRELNFIRDNAQMIDQRIFTITLMLTETGMAVAASCLVLERIAALEDYLGLTPSTLPTSVG